MFWDLYLLGALLVFGHLLTCFIIDDSRKDKNTILFITIILASLFVWWMFVGQGLMEKLGFDYGITGKLLKKKDGDVVND